MSKLVDSSYLTLLGSWDCKVYSIMPIQGILFRYLMWELECNLTLFLLASIVP